MGPGFLDQSSGEFSVRRGQGHGMVEDFVGVSVWLETWVRGTYLSWRKREVTIVAQHLGPSLVLRSR